MFRTCIVLAGLVWCGTARAERAVLECVADTAIARGDRDPRGKERTLELSTRGAVALAFRTAKVQGWHLQQVVLLLHLAGGPAPGRIRLAALTKPWSESTGTWESIPRPKGQWRRVRTYDENWIAVDVTPQEATADGLLLSGAGARFDARESAGYAPYLLVEGKSGAKQGSSGVR